MVECPEQAATPATSHAIRTRGKAGLHVQEGRAAHARLQLPRGQAALPDEAVRRQLALRGVESSAPQLVMADFPRTAPDEAFGNALAKAG